MGRIRLVLSETGRGHNADLAGFLMMPLMLGTNDLALRRLTSSATASAS